MLPSVEIGDLDGKIVVWLNKESAIWLAGCFDSSDGFYRELMDAVAKAYPEEDLTC